MYTHFQMVSTLWCQPVLLVTLPCGTLTDADLEQFWGTLTMEPLVEWSFSPPSLSWSPLDLTTREHLATVLNIFFTPVVWIFLWCVCVCMCICLSLSFCRLKLWIFDQSDGSARLLRSRCGHSAPPTRLRFCSTGEAVKILSTGSYSILHSPFHVTYSIHCCFHAPGLDNALRVSAIHKDVQMNMELSQGRSVHR